MVATGLRAVQELIDEEKENIQEGLYLQLMNALQTAHEEDSDGLHVIRYVVIDTCLQFYFYTAIVEETLNASLSSDPDRWHKAIHTSMITGDMLEEAMPSLHKVASPGCSILLIISVDPR